MIQARVTDPTGSSGIDIEDRSHAARARVQWRLTFPVGQGNRAIAVEELDLEKAAILLDALSIGGVSASSTWTAA